MKTLSGFTIRSKRAILFTAFFLSVIGGYLILSIPQGVFPDSAYPRIAVEVDFGLAPLEQMEMQIVKPVEESVLGIPGAKAVRSKISRGAAVIDIDFEWKTEMLTAYQLTQARVSGIQNELPDGVKLKVRRYTTSTYPVLGFSMYSDRYDLVELNDLALYTIRPQLASIPGVEQIEIMGGKTREYWINLDSEKLVALHLEYKQVVEALNKTNTIQFISRLNQFNKLYLNIADNRYADIRDIGSTIIINRQQTPIRLSDVATIEPEIQESFINCISNLKPSVLVNVIKQPGTNAVSIAQEAEKRMMRISAQLPPGIEVNKWYDLSEFIRKSIHSVSSSIFLGALFTMLVLLLFLRRVRITLVTAAIIPTALLITFIPIKLAGMNLSLMSLGGLAAAIGILVDNAIVMIENIERYRETGISKREAVVKATNEIIVPLLGATVTTLVVFIPLVFLTGLAGIFFRALAITLTFAIAASMLLAIFLTPALAIQFISPKKQKPGRVLPRIVGMQQCVLKLSFRRPYIVVLLILLMGGLAVGGYLMLPSGFLPLWDEDTIIIDCLAPPGSSLESTENILRSIGEYVMRQPEVEVYSLRVGRSLAHSREPTNFGDFAVTLKSDRKRSSFEMMDDFRAFIEKQEPRLHVEIFQVLPDRLMDLSGRLAPIVIKVFGNNLHQARDMAVRIADSLDNIPGIVDVFPGFEAGEPELTYRTKLEAATRYGLNVEDINSAVNMALWGKRATEVIEGQKIIPVRVRYPKHEFENIEDLQKLPLYFKKPGRELMLEEIVELRTSQGKMDVDHANFSQVVNVEAHISKRDLGSVVLDVKKMMASMHLPAGVSLQLGGEYESQQQAFHELLLILLFGSFLVYSILLFEFKSLRTAFVILFGTVLSVSGVFMSLHITGIALDISAFMGMIMIIGVVVNNGILLIDYAQKNLSKGQNLEEALLSASRIRLRPIMMTTLSTIFGFLPLALALGDGSEMLQPLAVAMIGGMSVSMLISLLVIPTMFRWTWSKKYKEIGGSL